MSATPQASAERRQTTNEASARATRLPIVLRRATADDFGPLGEMLRAYWVDCDLPYPEPNDLHCAAWFMTLIAGGNCIIAVQGDKLVGSVALEVARFPWNPTVPYLHEHWNYVVPEKRDGGLGLKLVIAAQDIADMNNMLLMMGVIWGYEPERMHEMCISLGFRHVGSAYIYSPKGRED